jgi:hypothetical protein
MGDRTSGELPPSRKHFLEAIEAKQKELKNKKEIRLG